MKRGLTRNSSLTPLRRVGATTRLETATGDIYTPEWEQFQKEVLYPRENIDIKNKNYFCHLGIQDRKLDGKLLRKIGVWAGHEQINAIRIWLGDDLPVTKGLAWGSYKELEFKPGERITKLSLWYNGARSRITAIHFKTSAGEEFDHVMTEHGRAQEYPIDIGSGICAGVEGIADQGIYDLAFIFLKPVACFRLTNVTYPTLGADSGTIAPVKLQEFKDQNLGTNAQSWKFAGSHKIATSSSWSVTMGLAVHAEMSVEASIPEVAKIGAKFGWNLSLSATHGSSRTEESSLSWEASGTLQPGDTIDLIALTRMGQIDVPYTGEMEVIMKSGYKFKYQINGQYSGVSYTEVEIGNSEYVRALKAAAAA